MYEQLAFEETVEPHSPFSVGESLALHVKTVKFPSTYVEHRDSAIQLNNDSHTATVTYSPSLQLLTNAAEKKIGTHSKRLCAPVLHASFKLSRAWLFKTRLS